jgi:hypothetical protein
VYVCNGFQVFFRCFFKCFRSMFQMFHLPSDVCCNCCIWMFQKQIGCYISPPRLLLHCLGVSSSRCRQGIHTTPRRPGPFKSEALPPSPLVARAAWAPRGAKQSAACERPSGRPGASTAVRDRVNLE